MKWSNSQHLTLDQFHCPLHGVRPTKSGGKAKEGRLGWASLSVVAGSTTKLTMATLKGSFKAASPSLFSHQPSL